MSGNAGETQLTWYEARETCAAEGGDLATFTTLEEQMFVVNKVQLNKQSPIPLPFPFLQPQTQAALARVSLNVLLMFQALGIGYTGTLWHGLNQLDDKYFGEFK